MRRITSTHVSFGPDAAKADPAVVRVRASYLLGRWGQAPTSDLMPAREAET